MNIEISRGWYVVLLAWATAGLLHAADMRFSGQLTGWRIAHGIIEAGGAVILAVLAFSHLALFILAVIREIRDGE